MQRRSAGALKWRQAVLASIVTATLLLVFPSAPAEEETYDDWARFPEIRVGDHWTYEFSGNIHGEIRNEVKSQETKVNTHFRFEAETFRIESKGTVYSQQVPSDPLGMPVSYSMVSLEGEHRIDADKWIRVDDHATVQFEGRADGDILLEGDADTETLESFNPAFVQAYYPFTTGWKWKSTAQYYLEQDGESKQGRATLNAHVTDIQTIEVPAGTFETFRIEIDIEYEGQRVTSNVVQWWGQETCSIVREDRYNPNGELYNRMELSSFNCSGGHLDEPDYTGRGVTIDPGGKQPPWLEAPLEKTLETEDGPAGLMGTALPSGPVIWIALGVMAGASVMFILLGTRRN